jgi:hypothetical protein
MKKMKIEASLNTFDCKEWWFDLGISCQKSHGNNTKMVFCIALGFFSICIRW